MWKFLWILFKYKQVECILNKSFPEETLLGYLTVLSVFVKIQEFIKGTDTWYSA